MSKFIKLNDLLALGYEVIEGSPEVFIVLKDNKIIFAAFNNNPLPGLKVEIEKDDFVYKATYFPNGLEGGLSATYKLRNFPLNHCKRTPEGGTHYVGVLTDKKGNEFILLMNSDFMVIGVRRDHSTPELSSFHIGSENLPLLDVAEELCDIKDLKIRIASVNLHPIISTREIHYQVVDDALENISTTVNTSSLKKVYEVSGIRACRFTGNNEIISIVNDWFDRTYRIEIINTDYVLEVKNNLRDFKISDTSIAFNYPSEAPSKILESAIDKILFALQYSEGINKLTLKDLYVTYSLIGRVELGVPALSRNVLNKEIFLERLVETFRLGKPSLNKDKYYEKIYNEMLSGLFYKSRNCIQTTLEIMDEIEESETINKVKNRLFLDLIKGQKERTTSKAFFTIDTTSTSVSFFSKKIQETKELLYKDNLTEEESNRIKVLYEIDYVSKYLKETLDDYKKAYLETKSEKSSFLPRFSLFKNLNK